MEERAGEGHREDDDRASADGRGDNGDDGDDDELVGGAETSAGLADVRGSRAASDSADAVGEVRVVTVDADARTGSSESSAPHPPRKPANRMTTKSIDSTILRTGDRTVRDMRSPRNATGE